MIEILMVEDSESDIQLTKIAFKKAKLMNRLSIVRDGKSALQYLKNEPPYESAARPDLILLDLKLPRLSGHGVLKEIKQDSSLRLIPVVVLTSSDLDSDVLKSYELSANCYITKPVDINKLLEVVKSIEQFWIKIVRLPPVPKSS
ncbi:response regulator [Pelagicoccus albus]|nr:response regulator [Pelagicoccus albus]